MIMACLGWFVLGVVVGAAGFALLVVFGGRGADDED